MVLRVDRVVAVGVRGFDQVVARDDPVRRVEGAGRAGLRGAGRRGRGAGGSGRGDLVFRGAAFEVEFAVVVHAVVVGGACVPIC